MGASMKTGYAKADGNERFTEGNYSTGESGMWDNFPALAVLNDPTLVHDYMNDFYDYLVGEWTLTTTEGGGGDATEALADEPGGILLVTNDALDNDSDELQKKGEAYLLSAGKPLWFEARVSFTDASADVTQLDMLIGLVITDTATIDGTTDGIFFQNDDGDLSIDYHCILNSTETASTGDTGVDLKAGVYNRFGMHWDGKGTVYYWIDGKLVATATANLPTDEELCITLAVQNGEAVAKIMRVDYVRCVQVR